MGELVVKHFRRSSASSEDKELITEIVVESSDTGRFLERMEDSRLTRPCFQTIDMRGRVAGECRRYAFNDRVHYLDDISFQMFERGLQENNGVYTVGTFEEIMGGEHTIQAQEDAREEQDRRAEEIERRRLERARAAAMERARADNDGEDPADREFSASPVENPEQLPLGYFRRRRHPRLQYACSVTLQSGNIKSNGVTRDISVCGCQVRIKGLTPLKKGQEVLVSLPGLQEESGKVDLNRISYKIVHCEQRDTETVLSLRRLDEEQPPGFSDLIEDLIGRFERKYKFDIEDEYQSILSWYYERCYAQSVTQIPFFIEQKDAAQLRVQAVAMSEGNSHLARFFCTDADNYNFTPLCLPQRLQRLEQGGSFLVAMYRQRGEQDQCMRIHSAADFECSGEEGFQSFIDHALSCSEHAIVKIQVSGVPLAEVPETKVDEASQRLQYKSETSMIELRDRLKRLRMVGLVSDVTGYFSKAGAKKSSTATDLTAWVGTELRGVTDGSVRERADIELDDLRPELIRFGYVERRREDRYLAETKVEVRAGKKTLQGMSKDISTRGMRIQLDSKINVKTGINVKVGLVSLQKKKSATNLMDIPYRIVASMQEEDATVLMLERILGGNQEGLKEFFVELITKNQNKLGVDIGDIWGAASSRVYEALLAANTPTVPFFLARNAEGGACLQFVGIPEAAGSLQCFFDAGGEKDFRCLNESRVVTALYDSIQILSRQNRGSNDRPTPFELELYLYKEVDEVTGGVFIHAATELDFSSDAGREAYLMKLSDYEDWRCLKIVATFTEQLNEKVFEKMIDLVRNQSRHRAIKLSELVHSVVGYGELIDITEEWSALRAGRSNP